MSNDPSLPLAADRNRPEPNRSAFRFVLLIGIGSFFADFTYEGSRGILGPYLASLSASATVIGIVLGFGELVGYGGHYHEAFATLLIPGVINLALVWVARILYPRPQDLESAPRRITSSGLPTVYWVYLAGAALVAAGFADYPLIAYHFAHTHVVPGEWIAIFYSIAMAVSGTGSLVLGRLFDRYGFRVLIVLTLFTTAFAPLVFLGTFWIALLGAAVWGLGMGVHESIIPAAVAPMVSQDRRACAFGLFTAGYGVFWFLGSAAIGFLYDHSVTVTIAFCVLVQLAAVPIFVWVSRSVAEH